MSCCVKLTFSSAPRDASETVIFPKVVAKVRLLPLLESATGVALVCTVWLRSCSDWEISAMATWIALRPAVAVEAAAVPVERGVAAAD